MHARSKRGSLLESRHLTRKETTNNNIPEDSCDRQVWPQNIAKPQTLNPKPNNKVCVLRAFGVCMGKYVASQVQTVLLDSLRRQEVHSNTCRSQRTEIYGFLLRGFRI